MSAICSGLPFAAKRTPAVALRGNGHWAQGKRLTPRAPPPDEPMNGCPARTVHDSITRIRCSAAARHRTRAQYMDLPSAIEKPQPRTQCEWASSFTTLTAIAASSAKPRSLSIRSLPKPPAVATRGRRILPYAGPRIAHLGGPTATRTYRHHLRQCFGIETVRHSERDGLAGDRHDDAQSHVVAQLRHLPCSGCPQVKMLLPMELNTSLARSKAARFPPTMKVRVPAVAPAVLPDTAHRSSPSRAPPRNGTCHLLRRCGRDGATVDHKRTFTQRRQEARLIRTTQVERFHTPARGQHRDADVRAFNRIAGGNCGADALQ